MEENFEDMNYKNNKKRTRLKIIIVVAIITTYIMIVIIGKITNIWTLGEKDSKDTENIDAIISVKEVESGKEWIQLEQLDIFEGIFYNKLYKNIIAPGFTGTYVFQIENNLDKDITYVLTFTEKNVAHVNMVYSVQKDGYYIIGNADNREHVDGVILDEVTLPANSKTTYKLNWKWEDTNYDTEIGELPLARYKITMKINATAVEKVDEL